MMRIEPEISSVSIVLVGSFNPPIFHPEWFASHHLISDREKEAAEVEIIHREIALFRMEWLSVRVEPQSFMAETQEAPFIRLADFVTKTFKEYLNHTPVHMMGINRLVHFSVGDEGVRNRLGQKLAPHEPWGGWAAALAGKSARKRGGLRSLTMVQRDLDDRQKGRLQARIEPSIKINNDVGIFMEVNDHYEVEDPGHNQGCTEMIDLLEQRFDGSIEKAEWIIDQIMALKDSV